MKRHRITLLIALCFVMLFGQESVAQTAMERLKTEYPAVMEQYGKRLEALKADYVIAIDVSGTMDHYRETVVPALQEFLGSIPDGDYVCILKFGTVTKEAGLSGQISQSNRASFQQTLDQIYERDNDCFYQTNICKMLEAVHSRMSRPGHNDLQYVFMFTDFVEDANSTDADWSSIAAKMKAASQKNIVLPFAMQLNGSGAGRDIPKVQKVLSNLRVININSASELKAWFEEQKADISASRLKDLIRGDFDQWYSEGKIQLNLAIGLDKNLRLKYKVDDAVPAFVTGFFLDTCEIVKQSSSIEKVTIKTDSSYKGRNISEKIGFLKFFNKQPWQKNVSITANVSYRPMFVMSEKEDEPSFANEIRKLGLDQELTRTIELPAEKAFVIGWNIWLACALLVVLLVFLFFFVKITVLPHKLNKVKVDVDTVPQTQVALGHEFKNEVSHLFGKNGVMLPQAKFLLKVYGRRGFPIFVPRSIFFEVVEKPDKVNFTFSRGSDNIPSLKSKVKIDDTVKIQQGSNIYTFTIKNV